MWDPPMTLEVQTMYESGTNDVQTMYEPGILYVPGV